MEFFRNILRNLFRLLAGEESDKSGVIGHSFYRKMRFVRAKITERLVSSPDEFPMQRTLGGEFSGLIDLWQRDRCPKTLSQQC
jgi:hypothetical protein